MTLKTRIKSYWPALVAAVLLTPLSLWLLAYCWPQHHLYYRNYRFDASEARNLAAYPRAMLTHGDRAWENLASTQAVKFYRRAVSHDVLYMDAWLKLARTEAAQGQLAAAREILTFVADLAGHTSRWQPTMALLAHELGMEAVFRRSVNFLIKQNLQVDATLNLLNLHCGDAEASVVMLDPANLPVYLNWLMRWNRVRDARFAWRHLTEINPPDESILLKYIDFLILNKIMDEARLIWRAHTGASGVTNGDFEGKPRGSGFGWRAHPSPDRYWEIRHAATEGLDNSWGLEVIFFGTANVDFHHLYQIVPLTPATDYRLSYGWRGLQLNTDQGPFVDLVGYGCDGFYTRGPMLQGSTGWRSEHITFSLPPDCSAVSLRLRRKTSYRFDNKIKGRLWLDGFRIEPLSNQDHSE